MTKVRITSDGTSNNTRIYVNDVELDTVVEVHWSIKPQGLAQVTLKLLDVALDVDGQMALKFEGSQQ